MSDQSKENGLNDLPEVPVFGVNAFCDSEQEHSAVEAAGDTHASNTDTGEQSSSSNEEVVFLAPFEAANEAADSGEEMNEKREESTAEQSSDEVVFLGEPENKEESSDEVVFLSEPENTTDSGDELVFLEEPKAMEVSGKDSNSHSETESMAKNESNAVEDAKATPQEIVLEHKIAIANVENLVNQLNIDLATVEAVKLNAGDVDHIDTAGLQVLVGFVNQLKQQGKSIEWSEVSDEFQDFATVLALDTYLDLSNSNQAPAPAELNA